MTAAATARPPAPLQVRPATAADVPVIESLVRAEKNLSKSGLDRWERFLVAERAGAGPIGIVQVKPHHGGAVREMATLVVAPQHRSGGVGAQLVREVLERMPPPVYARSRPELVPYYERLGFRPVGVFDAPAGMLQLTALAGAVGLPARVIRYDGPAQAAAGAAAVGARPAAAA